MGNQIMIREMNVHQDDEQRQLAADLAGLQDRKRKIEADWQKRIDEAKR